MKSATFLVLGLAAIWLAGCSTVAPRDAGKPAATKPGGYYLDDGPGDNPPPNLQAIPDAVPKAEPPHRFANRPYSVMGKNYAPDLSGQAYKARGMASWYGRRYHGKATASGEPYDMYAMTAAHPTLPIPSYVRVTNPANGKSVVVRINDRGPFLENRLIDLSYTAALKLDTLRGVTLVEVERILPGDAGPVMAALAPGGGTGVLQTAALPQPAVPLSAQPLQAEALKLETVVSEPVLAQVPELKRLPGIYLQLGAFASPAAADALIGRLSQQLGGTLPGVHRLQTGGLYKVQAGPFVDTAAADRAAAAIHEALGIRPYKVQARLSQSTETL